MSDQIQETPQVEVSETVTPASAPATEKKDNWFLKIWRNRTKRSVFMLACCLVLILIATFFGSMIQTAGWKATVTELRDETNSGTIKRTPIDDSAEAKETSYSLTGSVSSGLLYVPQNATAKTPAPAIVFTHGLYNNREMQLQNVIEMVRRGYVVLTIDYNMHGHNTTEGNFPGDTFVKAAAYLHNLPYVDKARIGVSGHSMGGGATASALTYDAVVTGTQTATNFKAGKNLGIISAGLVQANAAPTTIGSTVIAAGVVKASSDEFFFGGMGYGNTLKEPTYVIIGHGNMMITVDETNYTNYYLKKGNEYVKQTEADKFNPNAEYYALTSTGNSTMYLQSLQAITFVKNITLTTMQQYGLAPLPEEITSLDKWDVVNGGIYANGELIAQPENGKLACVANKGAAIASTTTSIRAIYEAKETHPMNHFSVKSASHVIDFFYNAFGTPEGVKYIAPTNQTWWLKEAFAILGFVGIFGLIFPVVDILLGTRLFASLKAKEGEVSEGPVLLTRPRKHVSYWLSGILTAIFGAVSLKHSYGGDSWILADSLKSMMSDTSKFVYNDTVAGFAAWGIMCAMFAVLVTVVIWFINRCINIFKYGDASASYDERPFDGFKIRSWQNVLKTPLLALIVLAVFYCVMFGIWGMSKVDFRFWTFDLRIFDFIRIPAMLKYVPCFFVFYMVTSALSQNYRVKDLPEWATIIINVVFNIIGVLILLWASNSYFIRTGAQTVGYTLNLFYIAAIPIIPCVGFATVIARRLYVRTGNAWLAGIINAVIMTFIACANTSIIAQPVSVLIGA